MSWSDLSTPTWAVVRGHDAGGGQAVELIGVDGGDLRGGPRADFTGGQRLMWSELRPARAPVVMERRSAVSSLLTWAVVRAAAWSDVSAELGGAEGAEVGRGEVVDLLGRQRLDLG